MITSTNEKSLYDKLTEAGCETDHHESDLYVRYSPLSFEIVKAYSIKHRVFCGFFTDCHGQQWIEVPFFYSPFWKGREDTNDEKVH